jgi:hypothetical protein
VRHVSHIKKDTLGHYSMLVFVDAKVSEFLKWPQTKWFDRVYLITGNPRIGSMQSCLGFFDGIHVAFSNKKSDVLDVWREWIGSPMRGRESQMKQLMRDITFDEDILWSYEDEEFCLVNQEDTIMRRSRSASDSVLICV